MTDRRMQYHSDRYNSEIQSDVSMLDENDQNLIKMALNKEWTNPKYKLKYFVGQAQITPYAKFRQWLLELKSKEESIENMEYEIAKHDLEVERFRRMAQESHDDLDRRQAEIEQWNRERLSYTSKRRLQDWYLERQHLIDLMNEFMASDEAYIKDGSGRTYLDIMNTEEEDKFEREMWTNRLAKQAACDMLFYGRIGSGNMDAILMMDPDQQAETLGLTINFATQLQHYQLELQKKADLMISQQQQLETQDLVSPKQIQPPSSVNFDDTNIDKEMFDVYRSRANSGQ